MKERALDVVLRKNQKNIIDNINPDTERLWKLAKKNLQWLQGDPIKTPDGDEADFSMFDFIVATAKYTKKDLSSDLTMLQRFWITLYPYVENLINHQIYYQKQFQELYGIEGETLKNYALQNMELQYRQKFMKEAAVKTAQGIKFDLEQEFMVYYEAAKLESDAEIVKIKAREEKWREEQEAKAAKRKEESDREAFAASLS